MAQAIQRYDRLELDRFKRSSIPVGLAFGLGGIGSAVLGAIADHRGIPFVFHICSYLPLIALLTALLPNLSTPRLPRRSQA